MSNVLGQCYITSQFDKKCPFNAPGYFNRIALADLDNDNDLDMIIGLARYYGSIVYYENVGGNYQLIASQNPFKNIMFNTKPAPAFYDVDIDSDLDLVIGTRNGFGDGILKLYRNNGQVFEEDIHSNPFWFIKTEIEAFPHFVDIDSDDDMDLFVTSYSQNVKFYRNIDGEFVQSTGPENPLNYLTDLGRSSLWFIDYDKDNDLDLFVGKITGDVVYYENLNDSLIQVDSMSITIQNASLASVALMDLDQDGDLDLVIGTHLGKVYNLLNENNRFLIDSSCNFQSIVEIDDWASPVKPEFVDLDLDDDLDLILGNLHGRIRYFENNDNNYEEKVVNPFSQFWLGEYPSLAATDLDFDGDYDFCLGNSYGMLMYLRNDNGIFTEVTGADNLFGHISVIGFAVPAFSDTDLDGDLDLFVGSEDGKIYSFENVDGNFVAFNSTNDPFNGIDVGSEACPEFYDVDKDGDMDCLVGDFLGQIHYLKNKNGSFFQVDSLDNPFNSIDVGRRSHPAIASFLDHKTRLFIGNNDGNVFKFTNDTCFMDCSINIWAGDVQNNWNEHFSFWSQQRIPYGCDDVIIPNNKLIQIDSGQIGIGKTFEVMIGSEINIKLGGSLLVDPKF